MFQNNFLFYLLWQSMFRTVLSDQMTGDISKIHFTVKYLMTVDISESVYLIWQQVTSQRNLLEHLMSVFISKDNSWCFNQHFRVSVMPVDVLDNFDLNWQKLTFQSIL